jgi:hypothetical protein
MCRQVRAGEREVAAGGLLACDEQPAVTLR